MRLIAIAFIYLKYIIKIFFSRVYFFLAFRGNQTYKRDVKRHVLF